MGVGVRLTCSLCNTSYDLVEGHGFFVEQAIKYCRDCEELVSVLIGFVPNCPEEEISKGRHHVDKYANRCSNCNGLNLDDWPSTNPCPTCGKPMQREETYLWD